MRLTEEILRYNGFEMDEDTDALRKFVCDWTEGGKYYAQWVNAYTDEKGFLVEVISGEEMCRVRTCSVERVNTVLAMLKVNYRIHGKEI